MAVTPYGLLQSKQSTLEGILKAQQAGETSRGETTAQMGAMGKEFEEKVAAAEQKAEETLQKKARHRKKRKWYQKALTSLAPILLGMTGVGAIGAGAITGLAKGRDVYRKGKKDIKFARQQARKAKSAALSVDPRFGKTFLSKGLTQYKSGAEKKYGGILRQAESMKKSDVINQALMSGLTSGISGYGMGQLGGGLKGAWQEGALARGGGFGSKFGTGEGMLSQLFGKQTRDVSGGLSGDAVSFGDWFGKDKASLRDILEKKLPDLSAGSGMGGQDPSRIMEAIQGTLGAGGSLEDIFAEGGGAEGPMKLITMLLGGMGGQE